MRATIVLSVAAVIGAVIGAFACDVGPVPLPPAPVRRVESSVNVPPGEHPVAARPRVGVTVPPAAHPALARAEEMYDRCSVEEHTGTRQAFAAQGMDALLDVPVEFRVQADVLRARLARCN